MIQIVRYTAERAKEWNDFVASSKNATFLFNRSYMDYHSDRFHDHSLLFYLDNRLYALLPANVAGDTLYSHQGLSYGGLVVCSKATALNCCQMFESLAHYLRAHGIKRVCYKPMAWPYRDSPSEEDLYALFYSCRARVISRDVASFIDLQNRMAFSELRRRCARKAQKRGLTACQTSDFEGFWNILTQNLSAKYHAAPVHTLEEITMLSGRFPDNIRLFACYDGDEMLGGTVLYLTKHVAKMQYISASPKGKDCGALDCLFDWLINGDVLSQRYCDMGTSAVSHDSNQVNESLIFQKEGFGARAVCYDEYEWEL